PLPADQVRKHSRIGSLVITFGCRFSCDYCPIPAYNQRHYRGKSGPRLAEEMHRLQSRYGMRYFFGCDDNFFNDTKRALGIIEALASAQYGDQWPIRKVRWVPR
ncbi:MAG: radical SAM protein, partial [Armatimonadetes bacterium]|nr:radical SAM protein [Armatimonadota bacterium]